jgi:Tfp pilus assembly protein PilX
MYVERRGGARQRGITLFGLLFWAIIVGFVALIGMRVLPTLNEYFTIQRAVKKIASEVPKSGVPSRNRRILNTR